MYRELIESALNVDAIIAADHNVMPRAASVAVRGVQLANMGLAADADGLDYKADGRERS